jgi:hypothetical protein
MVKFGYYFLLLAFIGGTLHAAAPEIPKDIQDGTRVYSNAEYKELESKAQENISKLDAEFELLKKQAIAEYPELEKLLAGRTESVQRAIIKGYLAKAAFDWFKQKYISELNMKSLENGRKIVTAEMSHTKGKTLHYWLDEGIMESAKCEWDFEKRQACDYPDNFETYRVTYGTYEDSETLEITKDVVSENRRSAFTIDLHGHNPLIKENGDDVSVYFSMVLSVMEIQYKYDEFHKWRNQMAADIRSGIMKK